MSNESTAIVSDIDLDDWEDSEEGDETALLLHSLDSRRLVENKLEDIRLRREIDEFDFNY